MIKERHPNILNRRKSALIIVDMQQRFESVIPDFSTLVANIIKLVEACRLFALPLFYTEQYPKGLGRTSEALLERLRDCEPIEKMSFSICREPELPVLLREKEVEQILLVGIETHVCILQSALDLIHLGFDVHLPVDATSSRNPCNRDNALERLRQHGVTLTNCESALFELTEVSGTAEFKTISRLVK
jgi:nicotinamidase-related amidase